MILVLFAVLLHLVYYYSAIYSHVLDYWIPWGTIHKFQGWDYFQIPNGAYSFINGGELTGIPPPGVESYSFGSENVYHPLFTLILGYPLQLMKPHTGFLIWELLHLVVTIFIIYFYYRLFRHHHHFKFALIIYLIYFPNYLEIWNGQYHFLLDMTIFFLLIEINRNKDTVKAGILHSLGLLVKPIGLLWMPVLFHAKRWRTLFYGIFLFLIATLPFSIGNHDYYYISNLFVRIASPFGGRPSIFSLDAVLRSINLPWFLPILIKLVIATWLFIFTKKNAKYVFESLFLWTAFYLLFYDLVFEYHYTVLLPFIMIGLVTKNIFQKKISRYLMIWLALPTPFVLMHFFQIGAKGWVVTEAGWIFMVIYRVLPLLCLCVITAKSMLHQKVTTPK